MKVVYPICCGVDVHKSFLVATIITLGGISPKYLKNRSSTFNNSILKFKQWLIENNYYDVFMESMGKYWVPADVYLKPALVQVAHASFKSDKSPYYKNKYERIYKRRRKKRAIMAIARMIFTVIYNMLATGEVWNPTSLYKIDMPQ